MGKMKASTITSTSKGAELHLVEAIKMVELSGKSCLPVALQKSTHFYIKKINCH